MILVYWLLMSFFLIFLTLYFICNYTKILCNNKICHIFTSNMTRYIFRRLILSISALFVITTIVFFLLSMFSKISNPSYSNHILSDLIDYYKSIIPYPKKVCVSSTLENGMIVCSNYKIKIIDLGYSTSFMKNTSVWSIIKQKCSISLLVGLIAYLLECAISYPIGIFLARKNNKIINKVFNVFYTFVTSIPLALIFYIFLLCFMTFFHLPTSFEINNFLSYIPPIISVTFTSSAVISHWIEMYVSSESKKDYVTFAYSKGLNEKTIFNKHIMKNALIPLIRTIPSSIVASICGSYLLEVTFGIPGSGSTLVYAINLSDIPLIQGLIFFFSFLSIIAYFIGDLISLFLDPRVKLKEDNKYE